MEINMSGAEIGSLIGLTLAAWALYFRKRNMQTSLKWLCSFLAAVIFKFAVMGFAFWSFFRD